MTGTLDLAPPRRGINARDGFDLTGGFGLVLDNMVPSAQGGVESRSGAAFVDNHGVSDPRQLLVFTDPAAIERRFVTGARGAWTYDAAVLNGNTGGRGTAVLWANHELAQFVYGAYVEGMRRFNVVSGVFDKPTITYVTKAGGAQTLKQSPRGNVACVMPDGNRLAIAGFGYGTDGPGAFASDPSLIFWSTAGDPMTWNEFDYERLRPGDGEKIMGITVFRNQMYVFKESAFFVFTGIGSKNDGTAKFYYRSVETGVGLAVHNGLVATEDGLFFIGRDGIYVTHGSEPELVTDLLGDSMRLARDRAFLPRGLPADLRVDYTSIGYARGRLYIGVVPLVGGAPAPDTDGMSEGPAVTLVHDVAQGWWASFSLPMYAMAAGPMGLEFCTGGKPHADKASAVWRITDRSRRKDFNSPVHAGLNISCRVVTGFVDAGSSVVKTAQAAKLWGSGIVDVKILGDYGVHASAPLREELGDGTFPRPGRVQRAVRATTFGLDISGVVGSLPNPLGGAAIVHDPILLNRLTLEFEDSRREPGVTRLD